MSKDKFYIAIKKTLYRKFTELEVSKLNEGKYIYFHYKNEKLSQILITKTSGTIYYNFGFRKKITKQIPIDERDFEVLLERWVEDAYQVTATRTILGAYLF